MLYRSQLWLSCNRWSISHELWRTLSSVRKEAMRLKDSYTQMLDNLEKEVEKTIQDIIRLEKENLELKARIKELEQELSNAK